VIVCPRCSKENQDHYMFCLGCGTELKGGAKAKPAASRAPAAAEMLKAPAAAAAAAAPSATSAGSRAGVARGSEAPPSFGGAAAAAVMPENFTCPRCTATVPKSFRFCGSCGFDMSPIQAAAAAGPAPSAPVSKLPAGPVRLVLIRPDGSEGDIVPVTEAMIVGREAGGCFAGDSYLSPKHARIDRGLTSYTIEDLSSLNGVYLRIERDVPEPLYPGTVFRIGQEIIRFDAIRAPKPGTNGEEIMGSPNPGFLGRISLIIGRDTIGNAYPVPPEGMHLGRERGDIIFPDDGYVSGLHCRIHSAGGQIVLTDVGSSNGTFIRLTKKTDLPMGSLLLLGQQLFRIEA